MPGSEYRDQLDQVHKMGLAPAREIAIDLSVVKPDQEFNLAGNFFYIKDAPGLNEYIEVKVNSSGRPAVTWSKQTGFIQPFNRLYITTPAGQAGTMKILIASEAPTLFDILDHRSAISETMQGVLDELRGDVTPENAAVEITVGGAQVQLLSANATRKAFSLCADILNTGNIYLGFDDTVTTSAGGNVWFHCLTPGAQFGIDDYRGPIHAIATAADQLIGVGEW